MKLFNKSLRLSNSGPYFETNQDYNNATKHNIHVLNQAMDKKNYINIGRMIGISDTYDKNAPLSSRKSTMSVMLGQLLPSNLIIDPHFRKPLLGQYDDSTEEIENDSIEPIELFRGLKRAKYEPLGEKICRKNGLDLDFIDTGRTLLNYNEANSLMNQHDDIALSYVPWSDLNDLQVVTIAQTLLHDVKGGKIIPETARAQMLDTISEVLRAHSMSTKDWKESVLILATNTNEYSSDAEKIDHYEKLAKNVLNMANSYTLPVWTDLSVISSYWVNKSVYPSKVKKRTLADASIYESSEEKRIAKDDVEYVADQIRQLETMILSATSARPEEIPEIISAHADLAT